VNLLSNSVKFAPAASRISIGGRALEEWIEIWVEDAGPGVDPASETAIFERFRRAEGTEPDAPGLGWDCGSSNRSSIGTVEACTLSALTACARDLQ